MCQHWKLTWIYPVLFLIVHVMLRLSKCVCFEISWNNHSAQPLKYANLVPHDGLYSFCHSHGRVIRGCFLYLFALWSYHTVSYRLHSIVKCCDISRTHNGGSLIQALQINLLLFPVEIQFRLMQLPELCRKEACLLASLKSFLPVADCYELGIYAHLPAQQVFDQWSVSWSGFFCACRLHDPFPYHCVVVVTIKHRARCAETGLCECLVFPPEYEVSDVPFSATHPTLQMWGSKRKSHHHNFWLQTIFISLWLQDVMQLHWLYQIYHFSSLLNLTSPYS